MDRKRRVSLEADLDGISRVTSPHDLREWIDDLEGSVPPEHRSSIVFDFDKDYETGWSLDVYYERPETAEDIAADERKRSDWADKVRRDELAQLQRLKIKYEGGA